jgi:hypothetical protein
MDDELHRIARRLRDAVEPIAAAVFFAPEAQERFEALGLNYFEGYFCSRSACLGAAPWQVVAGVFAAFNPAVVEQAVTGGWRKTDPASLVEARLAAARDQMRRMVGEPGDDVVKAADILLSLTDDVDVSGRAMYAGLRGLPVPGADDPYGRLFRAAELVREHRGDGHIAAWIGHVDSAEISALSELWWDIPAGSYIWTRGWDEAAATAARERLTARGLLDEAGAATAAGRDLREEIERDTDLSQRQVVTRLRDRADELFPLIEPVAEALTGPGGYPADRSNLFGT